MARQKKEPEGPKGCAAWLATYGDMITLVLTFFVLLYSMSSLDTAKWKALVMNLSGSNAIFEDLSFESGPANLGFEDPPEVSGEEVQDPADWWGELTYELKGIVDAQNSENSGANGEETGGEDPESNPGAGKVFQIEVVESGDMELIFRVQGDILFDPSRAIVKQSSYETIFYIIETFVIPQIERGTVSLVRVEGHTDIRPLRPNSGFKDNMSLSCERASETYRFIREHYPEIPRKMLASTGYGEDRPIDEGNTLEAYAKNRRVEFVLVKNLYYTPAE